MCTVSYLPMGENQFILTSNRDETPKRQPEGIFHNTEKGLYYPKEPSQGGTWISVADNNRVLCLLNGAFDYHKHQPPYKRSRGLVVLDYFDFSSAEAFSKNYDFEGIEPFTLIIFDNGTLFGLRWDGTSTHLKPLDPQLPHIWSSSTLYPEAIKRLRKEWFAKWLTEHPVYTPEDILYFHQHAGIGDPENDLIMSRYDGKLCTVSHTQIVKNSDSVQMTYLDRIIDKKYEQSLSLQHSL
jgi:hypothetical protein